MLFRTLPNHYPRGSAYAHFPFMTPEFMKDNLLETQGQEIVDKYGWSRPRKNPTVVPIESWAGVKQVLEDKSFLPLADARIFTVAKPVVTKKLVSLLPSIFHGVRADQISVEGILEE